MKWRSLRDIGKKMDPFFLLFLLVPTVYCDTHTLRYYDTTVSSPESGLPLYSIIGYVDDREIINYNSDTRQCRPKTEWMKKLGSEFWEEQTQIGRGNEPVSKHNVRTAMNRFNQTEGIHIVQMMYGCELRDDGTTDGYNQYGYDGRDFMYLDTKSGIFIPTMNEAQITAQRWNSPEERAGERYKNYLENECIEFLQKYTEYGREDLEKRVRPEVKVWGRQSDGVTRLQCLVYGFHPRSVDVKWVRNGVDHIPSDEMSPILPHPDGTYQIRVSVELPTRDGDTYSCHVDHSSLEETRSVEWDPPGNGLPVAVIVGVVIGILVVPIVVVLWIKKNKTGYKRTNKKNKTGYKRTKKKNKTGYKRTNTSDTASDSACDTASDTASDSFI